MGGWNFIALRIPPLFQSPLLLGDLMGKVKAMYTEMEIRNNWKEADAYYESQIESLDDDLTIIDNIFKDSPIGHLFNRVVKRLDEAEYKIHKLEKEKEV
jgi:transposase